MWKSRIAILLGFALATAVLAAAGCRSTRSLRKVIAAPAPPVDTTVAKAPDSTLPARDLHADSMAVIRTALTGIAHNHIDFQTFSGTMHVHYQGSNGQDNEVNAVVRIKKDSIIWIEIYAKVGAIPIKAFQAMITPDSVKILDRIKKIVRLRSVSYLQEQIHLPVDFGTVQDLLIGNPIFLDTANILYYRMEKKGLSLFSEGRIFTNFLTLNPDNTVNHSKLDDTDPLRARTCDITYGDYDYGGPAPFSTYRKISVAEKGKVDIEIGINKHYKFNEVLNYPFSIPKNYKRR
ncbi:MAG TPA: DUF4292 domain-containing protein [Puia sp.]|jgi:hypothetical protein|nr:DUF4292 domain-containing protein [Puia sp.]